MTCEVKNSLSLVEIVSSFLLSQDLQHPTSNAHLQCNSIIKTFWDNLKTITADASLEQIVWNIEEDYMDQCPTAFTKSQREDYLRDKVSLFFHRLAERFPTKKLYKQIPIQQSAYADLQKTLEEEALQIIWSKCLSQKFQHW